MASLTLASVVVQLFRYPPERSPLYHTWPCRFQLCLRCCSSAAHHILWTKSCPMHYWWDAHPLRHSSSYSCTSLACHGNGQLLEIGLTSEFLRSCSASFLTSLIIRILCQLLFCLTDVFAPCPINTVLCICQTCLRPVPTRFSWHFQLIGIVLGRSGLQLDALRDIWFI